MLPADGLGLALTAVAHLDGDRLDNLRRTRAVQQAIVRMQIADVRDHLADGGTWAEVADALGIDEQLARARFGPHLADPPEGRERQPTG